MPQRYALCVQSLCHDRNAGPEWAPWRRAVNRQASVIAGAVRQRVARRSAMNKPVVLITGALTGIGRATALAFAKHGARLVVSGRREAEGKALEAELHRLGAEAVYIQADVRRDDEVGKLVDQTVARFGRLDVAVNNAGT